MSNIRFVRLPHRAAIELGEFNSAQLKVLTYLCASCWHENNQCFPTLETIADACKIGRATVARSLDWLEENNFITRTRRFNKSNVYHVVFESGTQCLAEEQGDSLTSETSNSTQADNIISNDSITSETSSEGDSTTSETSGKGDSLTHETSNSLTSDTLTRISLTRKNKSSISVHENYSAAAANGSLRKHSIPTLAEVHEYSTTLQAPAGTAEKFFAYYTERNWVDGRDFQFDWHTRLIKWVGDEKQRVAKEQANKPEVRRVNPRILAL